MKVFGILSGILLVSAMAHAQELSFDVYGPSESAIQKQSAIQCSLYGLVVSNLSQATLDPKSGLLKAVVTCGEDQNAGGGAGAGR